MQAAEVKRTEAPTKGGESGASSPEGKQNAEMRRTSATDRKRTEMSRTNTAQTKQNGRPPPTEESWTSDSGV